MQPQVEPKLLADASHGQVLRAVFDDVRMQFRTNKDPHPSWVENSGVGSKKGRNQESDQAVA